MEGVGEVKGRYVLGADWGDTCTSSMMVGRCSGQCVSADSFSSFSIPVACGRMLNAFSTEIDGDAECVLKRNRNTYVHTVRIPIGTWSTF